MVPWISRRCRARRASASAVSLWPTPFGLSAVGLKKGDAAMPISSPLVKAMDGTYAAKPLGLVSFASKSRMLKRCFPLVWIGKSAVLILGRDVGDIVA